MGRQQYIPNCGIGQSCYRPAESAPETERAKVRFNYYAFTRLVIVAVIVAGAWFWWQHGGQAYYWIGQKVAELGL